VTTPSTCIRPSHSLLLAWGLTAGAVVAGPSLLGAAQATPAVALASAAIGLTALVLGLAQRHWDQHVNAPAPARRHIRTLGWSPP
jgi:hypothetical protein